MKAELQKLYDMLGDGIAWNPSQKVVTFKSKQSADTFKQAAPSWTVQVYVTA